MRVSTAAALVGAGVLSVLIYPSLALARARRSGTDPEPRPAPIAAPLPETT
jgi:hypothetical protein